VPALSTRSEDAVEALIICTVCPIDANVREIHEPQSKSDRYTFDR